MRKQIITVNFFNAEKGFGDGNDKNGNGVAIIGRAFKGEKPKAGQKIEAVIRIDDGRKYTYSAEVLKKRKGAK